MSVVARKKTSAASNASKWANLQDWEKVKPFIRQLYVAEDRTLRDVMAIMAAEYDHHATKKMYASRFTKWGWDKNRKEDEMVFILQKTAERAAAGKKATFQVRGRVVTQQDVAKYFARKGGLPAVDQGIAIRPATPPGISYRSPSPPLIKVKNEEVEIEDAISIRRPSSSFHRSSNSPSPSTINSDSTFDHIDSLSIPQGYSLSYIPARQIPKQFLFTGISSEPAPPPTFRMSEELLYSINTYVDGSFQSGAWQLSSETRDCINIHQGVDKARTNGRFIDSCRMSITLMEDKQFIEARRMLSRACGLVHTMLISGNPRSVSTFLENFIWLKRKGFDEVTNLVRHYLGEMAATVLLDNHPLAKICNLIAKADIDFFEDAVIQSWKCTNDRLALHLGQFNETYLHSYLNWVHWVYSPLNPGMEETILRQYIEVAGRVLDPKSPAFLSLSFKMCTYLLEQERWEECEAMGIEFMAQVQASGTADERFVLQNTVHGLVLLGTAQYHLKKYELAVKNTRTATDVVIGWYSKSDPYVARRLSEVECWLREWGKEDEANAVKLEIQQLIEADEVDEESV
ncbi:hypothetical protein BJ878DRAFT_116428 [Calycina marina]|uniref:Clr5 domain-containing protein n=1 Tax=Calycina marina TaxID=1763456 RepID=A0A9P7Z1E3_9HELO|nr:hypothetical protein BJ878DRAFT_116428 [Calycina marina]